MLLALIKILILFPILPLIITRIVTKKRYAYMINGILFFITIFFMMRYIIGNIWFIMVFFLYVIFIGAYSKYKKNIKIKKGKGYLIKNFLYTNTKLGLVTYIILIFIGIIKEF